MKTHTEASAADNAYSKQVVDLSSFADGASHLLAFSYPNGAEGVNNMVVDDVGLSPGWAPHTAMPTVTGTAPASPSTSTTPKVKGTAEVGSLVTLHSNSTCTSAALGTGSAAEFAGAGITATVPAAAATTRIYAKAAKAGQNDSACSTTFVAYSHLGPPETTLVKTPKKAVPSRSGSTRLSSRSPRPVSVRPSSAASMARRSGHAPRVTSSSSRSAGTRSRYARWPRA